MLSMIVYSHKEHTTQGVATMATKAHEVITDRILAALEQGTIPWRKPWALPAGTYPQSVAGHRYSGINAVLLGPGR